MIRYRGGYKYQLAEDHTLQTTVRPLEDVADPGGFITLSLAGVLTIKKGYAWDGPSGPTKSISEALESIPLVGGPFHKKFLKAFMRGSLVHDALYQLIRMELLSKRFRKISDEELRRVCLEDGMSRVRACWVYKGVRAGGAAAASPSNKKIVHTAP